MLIIGEKIHILNPEVFQAVSNRDIDTIVRLACRQVEAGADAIDINLGPGQQASDMLPEIAAAINQAVDTTLFFPSGPRKFPEAVNACNKRPVINAVTADPDDLARTMAAAECLNTELVVLLTRKGILPTVVDEWCLLAEEVIETAEKIGFPTNRLYLDPVLRSVFDPYSPAASTSVMETGHLCHALKLIKQLRQDGIRTLAGLSTISQHLPYRTRNAVHCSTLTMLADAGLDAVIMNPFDKKLMATANELRGDLSKMTISTEAPEVSMRTGAQTAVPQ